MNENITRKIAIDHCKLMVENLQDGTEKRSNAVVAMNEIKMYTQAISDMEAQAKIVTCGECEHGDEKYKSDAWCDRYGCWKELKGFCDHGKRKEKTDGKPLHPTRNND